MSWLKQANPVPPQFLKNPSDKSPMAPKIPSTPAKPPMSKSPMAPSKPPMGGEKQEVVSAEKVVKDLKTLITQEKKEAEPKEVKLLEEALKRITEVIAKKIA